MENGDSAHSEHTHRSSNNAGHDFVYGTRSLCTLTEEPEEKFPSALFITLDVCIYLSKISILQAPL